MLVHHDSSRTYAEAASAAATHARTKLETLIEKGRQSAAAVIDKVQSEVPTDVIVPAPRLRIGNDAGRLFGLWDEGSPSMGTRVAFHDHALQQACERAEVPWAFAEKLRAKGEWGVSLLADNLHSLLSRQTGRRFLIRSVNGEARGFLSDRFRRLDSRPIIDAFCQAAGQVGALPIEGHALDTKVAIKAILPRVFEPVPNEVMAFGAMLSNSDYGNGALSLRVFMLRLWCTNYAITDEALRQVHLGGQLPDDVSFSERTLNLDTARSASMIRDLMGGRAGAGAHQAGVRADLPGE
jgi:hypothetical protein